jgi:CheY-like chemotaxis protein
VSAIRTSEVERRRSTRIFPKGTVILAAGDRVAQGRIGNMSSGGLLALTKEEPAEALLGCEVEIELRLDAAHSEWLRLAGRVTRLGACEIAVALEASEPFVRLMEESANASQEHRRVRTVVLVDATPERRALIAGAFRASGCAVFEVSTPLEAIVRLGESAFEPELIAIADSLPSSTSDHLRQFVERAHPRTKLATIGDDVLEPAGDARWLSSADPQDDLIERVRVLLAR